MRGRPILKRQSKICRQATCER